jgi:hypothetical protein
LLTAKRLPFSQKNPYTCEQLLMNEVDLFTRLGIYMCIMDDWERKAQANKTYVNLHQFIQATYQQHLTSGVITAMQSSYTSNNHFAGLTTKDNVLDNSTANTIVELIATPMENLHASVQLQATTSNDANMAIFNASMQQVAANRAQRTQEHNHMVQQFVMMLTTPAAAQQFAGQQVRRSQAATQCHFIPPAFPNFAPTQQQGQPPGGACGGNCSCNGHGRRNPCGPAQPDASLPFIGGTHMIPFNNGAAIPHIPAGMQPAQQQNPWYSNITKQWANQNVYFTCGFDIKDWHTSATCPCNKMGHIYGFTHFNYMEYKWANHQFY